MINENSKSHDINDLLPAVEPIIKKKNYDV